LKAPHLLRVEDAPESFSQLVEAARADGLRVGWLELAEVAPLPDVLAAGADLGLLRAVSAGGGRTVAVKPLRGEPVLKDLLREHFLGCALVLVRGAVDAPQLRRDGEGWVIDAPEKAGQPLTTAQLAVKIRSPLPLA
jgi:hypothetical protein